jgi:uncharacterized YccA/Bax inhibitor family protein
MLPFEENARDVPSVAAWLWAVLLAVILVSWLWSEVLRPLLQHLGIHT